MEGVEDGLKYRGLRRWNYLGQIYPVEIEIEDMAENNTSASYLELLLSIRRDGLCQPNRNGNN